jgi:hypothetical protein
LFVLSEKFTTMKNEFNPQFGVTSPNVQYKWDTILPNASRPKQNGIKVSGGMVYSAAFNTSKRTGRNLWELLTPILPDPKNKAAQQVMEIALYQWLLPNPLKNALPVDNIPFITGVEFNEEHTLKQALKVAVTAKRNADKNIGLFIPALNPVNDICAPEGTTSCTIKIMATSCSIIDGIKTGAYITELNVPYNNTVLPPQNIDLPITSEKGDLIVIALSIEYSTLNKGSEEVERNLHEMPAGIIWAGYN